MKILRIIAAFLGLLLVYPIYDIRQARRCEKASQLDSCIAFFCCSAIGIICASFVLLSIAIGFLGYEYVKVLRLSGILYMIAFIIQCFLKAPPEAPYQRPVS